MDPVDSSQLPTVDQEPGETAAMVTEEVDTPSAGETAPMITEEDDTPPKPPVSGETTAMVTEQEDIPPKQSAAGETTAPAETAGETAAMVTEEEDVLPKPSAEKTGETTTMITEEEDIPTIQQTETAGQTAEDIPPKSPAEAAGETAVMATGDKDIPPKPQEEMADETAATITEEAEAGETKTEYSSDSDSESSSMDDEERSMETNRFERSYTCRGLTGTGKDHLEQGGQIIMPGSALAQLLETEPSYPMLFEIRNDSKGKVSHCGVAEFTAEEGAANLPEWMMKNLKAEAGEVLKLKIVSLEKCTFAKLQPHSAEFWAIRNLKITLEQILSANFFCLTAGDTIGFEYRDRKFYLDVLETRPAPAVCILNTDFEVEFTAAKDHKEPERDSEPGESARAKEKAAVVREAVKEEEEEKKQFQAFTGKKYTLAG